MIGMVKKILTNVMYIVWLGLGVLLITEISRSSLPSQLSTVMIVILLFLITYLPIKWFNVGNFKNFRNFGSSHRMKLQH